jgi:transposase InsO family protein
MTATESSQLSKQVACDWYDISRQAYYQACQRQLQREAEDELLLEMVRDIRRHHPRIGGRKLHHLLQGRMAEHGIARGRDALFDLLRDNDLLVPTQLSRRRTTRSGLWRCPNRLTDLVVKDVNQAWVSDITYLQTEEGFIYLSLITDVYSRYIVGYDLSPSLEAEGALRALKQATKQTNGADLTGLIHHSDHGVQYTAHDYIGRLRTDGILSSMGEVGNCYENALAERMNGILKCEYFLDSLFVDFEQAKSAVREAIRLYNFERPHWSLGLQCPADVYLDSYCE